MQNVIETPISIEDAKELEQWIREAREDITRLYDKLSRRNMQIRELKKKLEKVEGILLADTPVEWKNTRLSEVLNIDL